MSENKADRNPESPRSRPHTGLLWILFLGLALAIGGNVYQFVQSEQTARSLATAQAATEKQVAKLTEATQAAMEESQQRFDALKSQLQGTSDATLRQARSEVKRSSSQLAAALEEKRQELERKHQEVASQLSNLKEDTSSRLDQVSTDLKQTGMDLKRVVGDLGVMSGDVATNGKELAALKELGERNYFEFNLTKAKTPQKVGDIRVVLKSADPKHNRFTLEVLADDKIVEKKDRTINEPVQLYVAGGRQPYEIVINEVKKNQVFGYLATPKVKPARSQSS